MKINSTSYFKDEKTDFPHFENWVAKLEKNNGRSYERYQIDTELGITHIWGLNTKEDYSDILVIFPGARTTSLFWDLDNGLDNLKCKVRIFLVETNGLPNLSYGATPDIKSLDYGHWAATVFDKLNINKAFIAGSSFGGLICMKMALVAPGKINAAFLLNPGCLQFFSLSLKNLYVNILPILRPTEKNVLKFLEQAVLFKPNHKLSDFAEKMLVAYEIFAISRYKDKTQKPYYMEKELDQVAVDTYLLIGDKDLLFPFRKSITNAKQHIKSIKEIKIFPNVGHGIETYPKALNYIGEQIRNFNKEKQTSRN